MPVNLLWLLPSRQPDILDDHEQMPRIARRGRKAEVPIERNGPVVFGVNRKGANTDYVRDLKRAPECIQQQPGTDAAALCVDMNGEAREHQQRDRPTGHSLDDALRSLRVLNLAGDDGVEAGDLIAIHRDIGLRGIRLLGLQGVTYEEAIKLRLPAGELFDVMRAVQFFDMKQRLQGSLLGSNTEGSRNNCSRRA